MQIKDYQNIKFLDVDLDSTKTYELPYIESLNTVNGAIDFATYLRLNQDKKTLTNGLTLILKSDVLPVCTLKDLIVELTQSNDVQIKDLLLQIVESMSVEHSHTLIRQIAPYFDGCLADYAQAIIEQTQEIQTMKNKSKNLK